ncbi:MAG: hypothetical protein F4210_03430 [Holophagales bacterium]|nr:hypothetical protein [Holophagales bacterium]MYF94559.1 hypothetical protein [Holophagales bacterium]
MESPGNTSGTRIRALFEGAEGAVEIIAPFIKKAAFQSLLLAVPSDAHVRCVTRWRPREVAAGVSDPEVFELLESRGNYSLHIVDELHAKLYVAGARCLAGSANVTLAGLGESAEQGNIEVLVEAATAQPEIQATLAEIAAAERPATLHMARAVRRLADALVTSPRKEGTLSLPWCPVSPRPELSFRFYREPPSGFLGAADRALLEDLAGADVVPGLEEAEFQKQIRRLLSECSVGAAVLGSAGDSLVTRAEVQGLLEELAEGGLASPEDLWRSAVEWLSFFFPEAVVKQQVAVVGLRRAELLRH